MAMYKIYNALYVAAYRILTWSIYLMCGFNRQFELTVLIVNALSKVVRRGVNVGVGGVVHPQTYVLPGLQMSAVGLKI